MLRLSKYTRHSDKFARHVLSSPLKLGISLVMMSESIIYCYYLTKLDYLTKLAKTG